VFVSQDGTIWVASAMLSSCEQTTIRNSPTLRRLTPSCLGPRAFTRGIVVVLVAVASAVQAQGLDPTAMSLEELLATPVERVYGASKFLQKITDAPAAITIITADDIRLYGYRTLADVLRATEGISITYDRNYSYLGMRGLSRPGDYNSRVLVLIDGHRTNTNIEDQATVGTAFQLDVNLIERVEVIRGPSAALYGSSAFSVVVAIISKQGHQVDGMEASASIATDRTNHARVMWGKRSARGADLLVSGSIHRADGPARLYFPEFDTAATNNGYADRADGDRSTNIAATAVLGAFTAHGVYSARTKQVPTASFGTVFNSAREKTYDARDWLDVQYAKELGQFVEVLARAYGDRYVYDGYYPYSSPEGDAAPLVLNRDHFLGRWWGTELAFTSRVGRAHRVTAGLEFRQNVQQRQLNYDEEPRTVYIDSRPRTHTLALNLQDEFTLNRHVLLALAGRAERIATGATGWTPKIGVILSPRIDTTVKLLFSRALRAPSAYELYYDSPSNAGNRDLQPERTESLEVNVDHALTPSISVGGSLFRNRYRHLIVGVADASATVVLQNGLDVRASGLELSWTLKRRDGLQARASYSTLFDSDALSDSWTSGAPRHLAKLNVGRTMTPLGLSLGWELQYESARQTHNGEVLDPAIVTNVNVVRSQVRKGLDVNASVFNIFDKRFSEPVSENHLQGGVTQDGRRLLVGVTWRFR
jgi:outer membrane receptor for ferrienterochelin and colicins